MRHFMAWVIVLLLGNYALALSSGEPPEPPSDQLAQGQLIFEKSCKWCHGSMGKGDGPAAFFHQPYSGPRARDFTTGNYRFRSTPTGYLPMDQDLFRTITQGIPGYMPSFAGLTEGERWQVVAYIKTFNTGPDEKMDAPMPMRETPIPSSSQSIKKGRAWYFKLECHSCHGDDGRGMGVLTQANELKDDMDLPVYPLDLSNRFVMKNGASPRDIVRTLLTGLDGTPMASYGSQFEGHEEDAWHVANFILSLSASP